MDPVFGSDRVAEEWPVGPSPLLVSESNLFRRRGQRTSIPFPNSNRFFFRFSASLRALCGKSLPRRSRFDRASIEHCVSTEPRLNFATILDLPQRTRGNAERGGTWRDSRPTRRPKLRVPVFLAGHSPMSHKRSATAIAKPSFPMRKSGACE